MPPAETAAPGSPLAESYTSAVTPLCGWGGGERVSAELVTAGTVDALRDAIASAPHAGGAIARGMARSYGDAAQLAGGMVLDMTAFKGFELDAARGTVKAQAGTTISELLDGLVPHGWILPVVPGTQHVSVGGAIASDIHGKNHGSAGTFGRHVSSLGLLTADGELRELEQGDALFAATIGGMGLTGLILWATIELQRVTGAILAVDTDRVRSLDEALAVLAGPGGPYRVAWLDLLGSTSARGIVTRAELVPSAAAGSRASNAASAPATVRARAKVPSRWPGGILRTSTVRAYNELRYRRAPGSERGRPEGFGTHMFPLDLLDAWPRLYGRFGFFQYQLVVPTGQDRVLHAVIESLRRARVPCFLAVLKDFGAANDAPLSFPLAGWTLALDLPRAADGVHELLDSLDELVAAAGGRVYLSKDARLRPDALTAMYPQLDRWQATRDSADPHGLWRSDLALRTGLVRAG